MLPFTTMLVRLSLAPLEIARAYSEAFSSVDTMGASRLLTSKVDPYHGNASPADRSVSSGNRLPAGQSTYQAKAMSAQFHDNQVATVNYQILFTKRGSEAVLATRTTTVAKAMTGTGFASWKIAEFVQDKNGFPPPGEWSPKDMTTYADPVASPPANLQLKPEYYEFLQLEYQVLSTFDRKGPTNEIAALLEIASAIKEK